MCILSAFRSGSLENPILDPSRDHRIHYIVAELVNQIAHKLLTQSPVLIVKFTVHLNLLSLCF
jgi:hypothetical protein